MRPALLHLARQERDDTVEGIEAKCFCDRGAQVRVCVDVVEHAPTVRRFQVLDSADVQPGRAHDRLSYLDSLARHLAVRVKLYRRRGTDLWGRDFAYPVAVARIADR